MVKDARVVAAVAELTTAVLAEVPELEEFRVDVGVAGDVCLSMIRVKPGERGRGCAERALAALVAWADEHEQVLTATPDPVPLPGEGRMNRERLRRWYVRHGFIRNRGRRARLEYSEAMYRLPQDG